MTKDKLIEIILATIIALVGQVDTALITLLVFMALDVTSGVLKAIYNKNLSSKEMHKGACKKAMKMLVVIMATWLDKYSGTDVFRLASIGFLIGTEGLSIVENIGTIIELPSAITKFLESLKKED